MPARHCYRVRLLPPYIRQFHEVSQLLSKILNHTGTINIHSLASSIDSLEDPATKVATVTFEATPVALTGAGKNQWKFPRTQTLLSHNIVIDTHFHGFTVLNEVDSLRHAFDCIAVSGLAGHAFGSWNGRDSDADFMWLRDTLPTAFPNMRVMLYGYDTQLIQSESFQTIPNLASSLLHQLHAFGFFEPSAVPIIFIAHSLGGIVVKETLSQIANLSDVEEGDQMFLSKVKQVVFFGVPHQGMMISHLLPMVKGQPNEAIIHALSVNSPYLRSLDEQFLGLTLTREFDVISVYETHKSQTPQMLEDGTWKREGPWEILVKPESAVQRGSRRSKIFEINKDHSNLVKFSETDASLGVVVRFIRAVNNTAIQNVTRHDDGAGTIRVPLTRPITFSVPPSLQTSAQEAMEQARSRQELRKQMIDSLYNHELDYRSRTVEAAHSSTLDWLFSNNEVDLKDWLQQGEGIYWIRGKPGSGKSTIMKHIIDRYGKEIHRFHTDEAGELEITANFFLFQRGSLLQKSYEGLLRALLYQVLSGAEQLAHPLLQAWLERPIEARKSWTTIQLEAAWDTVMRQEKMVIRITLFLDALDEFEGPTHKIANFVQMVTNTVSRDTRTIVSSRGSNTRDRLSHSAQHGLSNRSGTQIRVCFASRAWNVFMERFDLCRGFAVEQHTSSDIENYIYKTAMVDRNMVSLLSSSDIKQKTECRELLSSIHVRAQGVFIWVRLVLENLLYAVSEGANIEELDLVMESLPDEIDTLYEAMLTHGVSRENRREAYVMLEILARSPSLLTLPKFQAATDCALSGRPWALTTFHIDEEREILISKDPDIFARRVRTRCRGMIDFTTDGHVQLMHDTVRTFIVQAKFKDILLELSDPMRHENGHTFLAKLSLAFIKLLASPAGLDISFEYRYQFLWQFRRCFQLSEQTTGISMCSYMSSFTPGDLLEGVFDSSYSIRPIDLGYQPRTFDLSAETSGVRIIFALRYGLNIYLSENLIALFEELPADRKDAVIVKIAELFLNSDADEGLLFLDTLSRLFDLDPSCVHAKRDNQTILQLLFFSADSWKMPRMPVEARSAAPKILTLLELLLKAGINPDAFVFIADHDYFIKYSLSRRPLHVSYKVGGLTEMLVMAGAGVNCSNARGQTPLDESLHIDPRTEMLNRRTRKGIEYELQRFGSLVIDNIQKHCEILISSGARLTTRRWTDFDKLKKLVSHAFCTTDAWREFERNPWIEVSRIDVFDEGMLQRIGPVDFR